jgi:hypothetical protein
VLAINFPVNVAINAISQCFFPLTVEICSAYTCFYLSGPFFTYKHSSQKEELASLSCQLPLIEHTLKITAIEQSHAFTFQLESSMMGSHKGYRDM